MTDDRSGDGGGDEFSFDEMEPIIEVVPHLTRRERKDRMRVLKREARVRRRLERAGIPAETLKSTSDETVSDTDDGAQGSKSDGPARVPHLPEETLEGRGALVAELDYDTLRSKLDGLRAESRLTTRLLLLLAISIVLALVVGGSNRFGWMLLNIVLGLWILLIESHNGMPLLRVVAAGVYEHGIEASAVSGRRFFLPWAVVTDWRTAYSKISYRPRLDETDGLRFDDGPAAERIPVPNVGTTGRRRVLVHEELGDLDRIRALTEERGGDIRHVTGEFADTLRWTFTNASRLSVVLSIVLGFALGAALLGTGLVPSGLTLAGLVFASIPLVLVLVISAAYIVPDPSFWYRFRIRPNLTPFAAVVVVMLLLYPLVAGLSWQGTWMPDSGTSRSTDPGESSLAAGDYDGQTLRVMGPVTVHDGEELILTNCTLRFRPDPWGYYGIWVGPGGSISLTDTTVECEKFYVGYTFEVMGDAVLEGCLIRHTASGEGGDVVDGGLEVHDGTILVRNTTFQECQGSALQVIGSDAVVENCTFRNVLGNCIGVYHGTANVSGCVFLQCFGGAVAEDSTLRLTDSTLKELATGVGLYWSNATLDGCDFEMITVVGVDVYGGQRPDVGTCGFSQVQVDMRVSRYTAWEPFCLVVTLLVGITSTYALLNARRRWLEWDMGVVDVRNTPPQPFSTTYPIPGSRR